jgi:hypothetical protein
VLGWYGKPRHKDSSDSWVFLDKFEVDGQSCDDSGYPYTFSAGGDGKIELWIDRQPVIRDKAVRPKFAEVNGAPIKLLRKAYPLQVNQTASAADGGLRLLWSSPLEAKGIVPTRNLAPVIPGGHTVDEMRSPGSWSTEVGNK